MTPNHNNRSRRNDPSKKFGQSGNRAGKGNFSKPGNKFTREDRPTGRGFDKNSGSSISGYSKRDDRTDNRTGGFSREGDNRFPKRPGADNRFPKREGGDNRFSKREGGDNRFPKREGGDNRFSKREGGDNRFSKREGGDNRFPKREGGDNRFPKREGGDNRFQKSKPSFDSDRNTHRPRQKGASKSDHDQDGLVRLNRYIANSGVCSRRKADELIGAGVVSVNGEVVTELGTKVNPAKDEVRYNGERLKREKMVYILLNKPKDYITTTDDPQERKTVMQLIEKATRERVYPIGRLDRNTTGLLLLTNDGNLSEKLSHPRNQITKIYHVELSQHLTQGDFNKISFGLELEDGFIKPDEISYVQGGSKKEIGIKIHSGKNRIVRRIFEHLGYEVVKLDRVIYANLTKKDLPRGRWRLLEDKEVIQLKHLV